MAMKNSKLARVETFSREDQISRLPDDILHHILSFLSTKEAFVTSTLSTRWRCLFNTIPTLDFRNHLIPFHTEDRQLEALRFMNSIDRMLFHRKVNIHKFCINWNECFDQSRVNAWISAVISHDVKNLILCNDSYRYRLSEPFEYVLPCCLFSCESLTELKISGTESMVFKLPSFVSLPNLKVLHLSGIRIGDEYTAKQLSSNCPALEELDLNFHSWINIDKVCISGPSLKSLILGVNNFEMYKFKVVIFTPSLESFHYRGHLAIDYIMPCMASLVEANIQIWSTFGMSNKELRYAATKLLEGISNVKSLTLDNHTFEMVSYLKLISPNRLTIFKLPHLVMSSSRVRRSTNIGKFFKFINVLPNLESLVFAEGICNLSYADDGFVVPECSNLLHLKAVELREFGGSDQELRLVLWFLENSKVLQKVTIISSSLLRANVESRINIMEKLLVLPRASTSCSIIFS